MASATEEDEDRGNASFENNEITYGSYEDVISSLPKVKGSFHTDFCLYQGFYYLPTFALPGVMRLQDHFEARSSDIIITSFPKSGTTWLKALVFAIVNRTRYSKEDHPLLTKLPHDCIRILELGIYRDGQLNVPLDTFPSPRLFHSHAPYTSLPKSMTSNECKIVYICRDPKDVFISNWFFLLKILPQLNMMDGDVYQKKVTNSSDFAKDAAFTHEFECFCKGHTSYGPYWDHVLSYWKASIEQPEKILFLKYEDLQRDPHFYVKKLAQFLGQPFSLQEEKEHEVQNIVDLCNFKFLSNLEVNKKGVSVHKTFTNDAYFRKGEVGDWKNYFTPDMAKRMDQLTKEKFDGHGLAI